MCIQLHGNKFIVVVIWLLGSCKPILGLQQADQRAIAPRYHSIDFT